MRRFSTWQIAGLTIALVLLAVGISGFFQTADAQLAPISTPGALVVEPSFTPRAVAQDATQVQPVDNGGPGATETAVQSTLFAQATQILAGVTQTAAIDQTSTATAQGTGLPAGAVQPTLSNGQILLGTAVPQGTPGAVGSGAAGAISGTCVYTVVDGDRIFRIALRFGLSANSVAQANGILNPDLIVPGQQLRIPNCNGVPTPIPTATPGGPAPVLGQGTPIPVTAQPGTGGGTTYIVQDGDTMFGIATRTGVKITALAQANNITNVNLIYIGQSLIIP
jgi:LysM repeat protein